MNFSNSSHLETLAGQLGMDVGGSNKKEGEMDGLMVGNTVVPGHTVGTPAGSALAGVPPPVVPGGTKAVGAALKSWNKGEMYDVIAKLKEIADANPEEARKLLGQHPQLPEAILYCMSEVGYGASLFLFFVHKMCAHSSIIHRTAIDGIY